MLNVIRILGAVLLLNTVAGAQNYKMLSLRAGGITSVATFPDVAVTGGTQAVAGIASYMAGVGLNLPLSGRISLQPELIYVRRGYEIQYPVRNGSGRDKYLFNTIQVPLFVKAAFAADRFRFFVFAGPAVDYSLSATLFTTTTSGGVKTTGGGKVVFSDGPSSASYYFDTATFRQMEISVQGGVAAGVRLGTGMLLLELRGGAGLTDFNRDEESKFRIGTLAVSYGFPLGSVGNSR